MSDQAGDRSPESWAFKAPRWAWWVATGFGSGRLKPGPGTWGSVAAVVGWCLLGAITLQPLNQWALDQKHPAWIPAVHGLSEACFLALPALMTWMSVRASDAVVRETGLKDPGYIVADEWAGQWIALWPMRWIILRDLGFLLRGGWIALPMLVLPLALFRLFDIWKPWPCHQIQSLPGGAGVVADDVVAGLYTIPLTLLLHPLLASLMR
ncbi:MAG TPA: phosphatidylglycerophosphatase A [Holophagaceae bacterium]|nr:phosphatidylglycerophosphatase A [Holophagaceae bacterium]